MVALLMFEDSILRGIRSTGRLHGRQRVYGGRWEKVEGRSGVVVAPSAVVEDAGKARMVRPERCSLSTYVTSTFSFSSQQRRYSNMVGMRVQSVRAMSMSMFVVRPREVGEARRRLRMDTSMQMRVRRGSAQMLQGVYGVANVQVGQYECHPDTNEECCHHACPYILPSMWCKAPGRCSTSHTERCASFLFLQPAGAILK